MFEKMILKINGIINLLHTYFFINVVMLDKKERKGN